MASPPPINDVQIEKCIRVAMDSVFRTMLRKDAVFVEKLAPEQTLRHEETYHVLSNVGFVGEAKGIVYLCLTDGFAALAVGQMLGSCAGDVDLADGDLVKDVIGELTNMTAGCFKNILCDLGYPCKLTLPTIVRGASVAVSGLSNCTRHIYVFSCDKHRIVADVQVNNPNAQAA